MDLVTPMTETPAPAVDAGRPYVQASGVLGETLEDDRVLMHPDTLRVVLLNPVAAVLWDALAWPQSLADLTGLLAEAYPGEDPDHLRRQTRDTLARLLENGLIRPAG